MSTMALEGLLSYLYGTLSPSNMQWVGEHLIEYAKRDKSEELRPYTMQEIDDMLDEAEAAFEAGDYLTNEEVFHRPSQRVCPPVSTVPRRKRISAYERSLQELEEGRVYEAKDVDDLFKQCLASQGVCPPVR